jgi:hypothetical protein
MCWRTAISLNIERNHKRSDLELVLKVETVIVIGTKAARLIGSAYGALRRG